MKREFHARLCERLEVKLLLPTRRKGRKKPPTGDFRRPRPTRQQGMQSKALGIARTMLKEQEPKEKVVKLTGLTPKQIEKLRQEISK